MVVSRRARLEVLRVAARSVRYRATVSGVAGNGGELVGFAPLAEILPVGLISPEGVVGLGGGRKFPGLPAERGHAWPAGFERVSCKARFYHTSDNVLLSEVIVPVFFADAHNRRQCVSLMQVPDKPIWYGRLDQVIAELARPALAVGGSRDASSLSCAWGPEEPSRSCGLASPGRSAPTVWRTGSELIAHLKRLAAGDEAHYERRRRQRLAQVLEGLRQAALTQPKVTRRSAHQPCSINNSPVCRRAFRYPLEPFRSLFFAHRGTAETAGPGHGDRQRF